MQPKLLSPLISIVSPVYRAETMIDELLARLDASLSHITENYEIILVEDGSKDRSWEMITAYCAKDVRIKGVKLSRNFGQHHAITAGLDQCRGEWIVVMDCDLQDQPEEIAILYNKALEGYDIVYARRIQRRDSFFKRTSSTAFYKIFSWLSGLPQDGSIANFGIYSRSAIAAVNTLREPLRSFATMIKWVGFKSACIDVIHGKRFEGKSSYSLNKLINLAIDISLSYSDKPLKFTIKLGAAISILSLVFGVLNLIYFLTGKISQPGYPSLIVSIWFLSGLILFTLGIIGLYIGKIFEGIKNRPLYLVEVKLNAD
jgi:glycosyltransferase involved in cell wall biosynthesis